MQLETMGTQKATTLNNQFLTFRLGAEEYGIEILRVQEIRGFTSITKIPGAPPHVRGVMNLRGTVIPVIDLRTRFSLPDTTCDAFTVIIVVNVGTKVVGLVVDAVSDVLNVRSDEMQPPPSLGSHIDTSFMLGMAKAGERLVLLLGIDRLFGLDELCGAPS